MVEFVGRGKRKGKPIQVQLDRQHASKAPTISSKQFGTSGNRDTKNDVAEENILDVLFVGISGGCASMRNAPDLRIQGTFHIFIVLRDILALSPFIL